MQKLSHILEQAQETGRQAVSVGVDLGSVYVSIAALDSERRLVYSGYRRHHGKVRTTISELLDGLAGLHPQAIAKTGTTSEQFTGIGPFVDPVVALLSGGRHLAPAIRNVFYIGAGSFHLIHTNEDGEYLHHTSNTACASGTGAFLDQQALRVNTSPEEFHQLACQANACPAVATRCAVFAKTDIIHLQQHGFAAADIAAGICKGMADSTLDVLLRGREITGDTMIVGGVAKNREIVRHIEERLGFSTLHVPRPELVGAIGAALFAADEGSAVTLPWNVKRRSEDQSQRLRRPALNLELSDYPSFDAHEFVINDDETEITVPHELDQDAYDVVIGIDIGSTSTKGIVTTLEAEPLLTIYRKTGGDPIGATQLLLKAISQVKDQHGIELNVCGVGTTGSGRKLIKAIVNADLEMNEITAHATAAVHLDPRVDTIIEIGGQDAKFTQLSDGVVFNSVMNHVCAAGTGSFVEEQAKKLGISLWDYGDKVVGVAPPRTSDRCTVFMERDLDILLSQGWSSKEVAASVLYSVCDNYLNKVVAGQHIGERIYFQGATARNKALVAAFEQTLGKAITVSPFCHLTGALGMALLLLDREEQVTQFRGLAFADAELKTGTEVCTLCRNDCEITVVELEDEAVGWGMKCGREYEEHAFKKRKSPGFDLFRTRRKLLHQLSGTDPQDATCKIAMPASLTTHAYLPLWGTFLRGLGAEVVLSKSTSAATCKRGQQVTQAAFCLPVIASHGHLAELGESDCDYIFLPHMIRAEGREHERDSQFCPYVQSHPSVIKASVGIVRSGSEMLSPIINFSLGEKAVIDSLFAELGEQLGCTRNAIRSAYQAGMRAQKEFQERLWQAGDLVLNELEARRQMGIIIFGRPYNIHDTGINVNLAEKMAAQGVTVIPLDCIREGEGDDRWSSMYWNYGHSILRIADKVLRSDHLFAVYFSNFSCGPDSYILTYFKAIMDERRKPFLSVQFDAHGADAGYVTRVEAALESFRAWKPEPRQIQPSNPADEAIDPKRTVFVPPMGTIGVNFFAAAFQGEGYKAEPLIETEETLDIGYRHVRGGECAPCPSTIGSFIKTLEDRGLKPEEAAIFMPTASGPCRFGQYACLDRLILREKGWDQVQFVSPTAQNSYCGLSNRLRMDLFRAIVCGDILTKMVLKTRPYEEVAGVTDILTDQAIKRLCQSFREREDLRPVLAEVVGEFQKIQVHAGERPRVGIVGEIYVRNSTFLNQDAVGHIESFGGEAMIASIAEWITYTSYLQINRKHRDWFRPLAWLKGRLVDRLYHRVERELYEAAEPILHDRREPDVADIVQRGEAYIPLAFEGESILTIGRALHFIEVEQVSAIVNLSPNFCMPGTTTSAIFAKIEEGTGIPVINNFYDGSGKPNNAFRPHLHCLSRSRQLQSP